MVTTMLRYFHDRVCSHAAVAAMVAVLCAARPKIELKVTAGAARPEGPPPMPEGLSRQPTVYTPRAGAVTALAASPWAPLVAVAGHKQIVLYHSDSAQLLGVLPFVEGVPQV